MWWGLATNGAEIRLLRPDGQQVPHLRSKSLLSSCLLWGLHNTPNLPEYLQDQGAGRRGILPTLLKDRCRIIEEIDRISMNS